MTNVKSKPVAKKPAAKKAPVKKRAPKPKKLTAKQQRFVEEYLIDLNATQAAIRAGYSKKTSQQMGAENLSKPVIQNAIAIAMEERSEKCKIDAAWILQQAVKVHERCLQEVPVLVRNSEGKWVESGEYKFDSAGANKSLEIAGKHVDVQAFNERHEYTGPNGSNLIPKSTMTDDVARELLKELRK